MSRAALGAGLAVFVAAASGCLVDGSFLDEDVFECSVSSDCGDGWGCVEATPYATDFCAPDCDATCDGVCTGGEEPLCLRRCRIAEDGTPGPCQGEGYNCVRTSTERNEGLCYPIRTCSDDSECGANEVCLTEYLRDLNPDTVYPLDNLYCVPRGDDTGAGCPAGSRTAPFFDSAVGDTPLCYPDCTVTDTRCPPAMACITQLQQLGVVPECALGNYGLSCQDDSNCFVGRCLDTGTFQGKICTVTCGEAARLTGGGCENLIYPYSLQGYFSQLECDVSAPSADSTGLCVLRYKTNFPNCSRDVDGAYPCATGLDCRQLRFMQSGTIQMIDVCTRDCAIDQDCNAGLGSDPARWPYSCQGEVCLFRPSAT